MRKDLVQRNHQIKIVIVIKEKDHLTMMIKTVTQKKKMMIVNKNKAMKINQIKTLNKKKVIVNHKSNPKRTNNMQLMRMRKKLSKMINLSSYSRMIC